MTDLPPLKLGTLACALFAIDLDHLTRDLELLPLNLELSVSEPQASGSEGWRAGGAEGWGRWGWRSRQSGFAPSGKLPFDRSRRARGTTSSLALTLQPPSLAPGGTATFSPLLEVSRTWLSGNMLKTLYATGLARHRPVLATFLKVGGIGCSRGSSGGSRLRDIDHFALFEGRANHKTMRVAVTVDLIGSDDHDVDRGVRAGQLMVNRRRHAPPIELAPLDDQEINITARSHFTACRRAKKNDLLRLRSLYNTADDIAKCAGLQSPFS